VVFLTQSIDLYSVEVTPRDDAPNPSALNDREVTKAAVAHLPQRVNCVAIGSNRNWIGRHCMRQRGNLGILTFGERTYRITTGEDASQALQVIGRNGATGLLYRLMLP